MSIRGHISVQEKNEVEYAEIPNWPGYLVGSDGSIWSKRLSGGRFAKKWRKMVGGFDRAGYAKITLCNDGKQTCKRVCSLVLQVFRGPPPQGMECCHENGNPKDNRLENLRWDTHRNNMADKKRHGTWQGGENSANSKLTSDKVREIRNRWARGGITQAALGAQFGVQNVTISAVVNRRLWRHVP